MIKLKTTLVICFVCILKITHAQESTVAGGGEATGTDGKVSYSVGQINYITESSQDGVVAQGVQQPYVLNIISQINSTTSNVTASVYPNPTAGMVMVKLENDDNKAMNCILYDASGKIVMQKNITAKQTAVDMTDSAEGTYYLKVFNDKKEVSSFKVIKNK